MHWYAVFVSPAKHAPGYFAVSVLAFTAEAPRDDEGSTLSNARSEETAFWDVVKKLQAHPKNARLRMEWSDLKSEQP